MPLIHSKTPKAFKKNIEIEMKHGRPQKQAVAIAYSEKREAERKKHMASGGSCMGASCAGCADPGCYAKGGEVREESRLKHPERFESSLGDLEEDKEENEQEGLDEKPHYARGGSVMHMHKPKMMAEGGESTWHSPAGGSGNRAKGAARMRNEREQEGVHKSSSIYSPGESSMGYAVRGGDAETAKMMAKDKLKKSQSMPKPHGNYASGGMVDDDVPEAPSKNAAAMQAGATSSGTPSWEEAKNNIKEGLGMAKGGEVQDGEPEMDEELHHAIGGELMDALDRKDKKGIMSALHAAVMECMNGDYK